MPIVQLVQDAALAGAAGYVGTKAMEQFNTRTYGLEPEADRQREEDVRPGPPSRLAAENLAVGVELEQDQASSAGMAFRYLAGLSWTRVYLLLRRRLRWGPVASGLGTDASMSLLLDETITPGHRRIGIQPSLSGVHPRPAFAAHLVFGLAVAGVMEVGTRLLGRAR